MPEWWEVLYEKRFRDGIFWSVPENGYVKTQCDYVLTATGINPKVAVATFPKHSSGATSRWIHLRKHWRHSSRFATRRAGNPAHNFVPPFL